MSADERQALPSSNDNSTAFEHFMIGYWNQMSPDIYSDFGEAIADFKQTEGRQRFELLRKDILTLATSGRFPSISEIEKAHNDAFWSSYDRILTIEQLNSCNEFRSALGPAKG